MNHPKDERTLVVIKPDGIQRSLIGEIMKRYERAGLKLVGIKMLVPTTDFIEQHYTLDPEWRRVTGEKTIKGYKDKGLVPPLTDPLEITAIILANLKKYMTSGPVIAMV
jgi:nucleoside-diphosphate kinase